VSVATSNNLFTRCAITQQVHGEWLNILLQKTSQESEHELALEQLRRQSNQENVLKVDLALEILNLAYGSL
jgi:hypothetical protein